MRLVVLLLVSLALPAGLVYFFGWWSLLGCAAIVMALCMFSVRAGRGTEATRSGALTRYDTGLG
ncbi:MAG: hypothetical protein DI563_23295 [Variovorax paradoxus]|uniref:Uncharacterized protein n=1 Tax=Variovorax paradoxus TaxID=34073 RepID=A0A2W5R819_VARPD|nr:MAG: hypothetical protein DI563_23295 [Variovorax paradoxus]